MDRVLAEFFVAWNETSDSERTERLRRSIAELIDPTGDGLASLASDRITNYRPAAPHYDRGRAIAEIR